MSAVWTKRAADSYERMYAESVADGDYWGAQANRAVRALDYTRVTVISGGAPGADLGALIGARKAKQHTGGWTRPGHKTDDGGATPEQLRDVYGLRAMQPPSDGASAAATASPAHGVVDAQLGTHRSKDKLNVEDADAVVAFFTTRPETGRGTWQTVNYALDYARIDRAFGDAEPRFKPLANGCIVAHCYPRPVFVAWDVHKLTERDANAHLCIMQQSLCDFLRSSDAHTLLVCGVTEQTEPGTQEGVRAVVQGALTLFCSKQ
jgi:hypothetical protein